MLKNYLGDEACRTGLKSYFKKYAYKNTVGDDLWSEFSEASGKDISAFMKPWLERSGFPLVTVEQTETDVQLTHAHFLDNPDKIDPERVWPIPTLTHTLPLLDKKSKKMNSFFELINSEARVHYLVNYIVSAKSKQINNLIKDGKLE